MLSGANITDRGYTFHEHLTEFGLINMNGRVYDPALGRFLSPDPYIQAPDYTQNFNRYSYALNNPFKYTDPSGNFLTWNIGSGGFSIGLNFTPIGIPLGFGINIGWSGGGSAGIYGEVGYRVGGTGFGAGVTASQSLDFGFNGNISTTSSIGVYASLGLFNAGANGSYLYSITENRGNWGWGISAGINLGGDDVVGLGFNIGYGSNGLIFGISGYYNYWINKDYASSKGQTSGAAEDMQGDKLNWFNENDGGLYTVADNDNAVPEGTVRIYSHGGKNSIAGPNGYSITTPEQLDKILMERSPTWRNYRKNGGNIRLELMSCNTGKMNNGFASKVSKAFSIGVVAPSDYYVAYTYKNGISRGDVAGRNRLINPGRWNYFYNGQNFTDIIYFKWK